MTSDPSIALMKHLRAPLATESRLGENGAGAEGEPSGRAGESDRHSTAAPRNDPAVVLFGLSCWPCASPASSAAAVPVFVHACRDHERLPA